MNEGPLGVEQIELVIQPAPCSSNSSGVGEHAERSGDLGKIASGDVGRRLVANTELESGRAPIDELNRSLGLDGGNGRVDVLGNDITSAQDEVEDGKNRMGGLMEQNEGM